MCLIVFSYHAHERYPLILAGNRDEFYDRPAMQAAFRENEPDLLAGKDLKGGGTWLGVNRKGQFAALTNYRDLSKIKTDAPSRGEIVKMMLTGKYEPHEFIRQLDQKSHLYNGFNLLGGSIEEFYHYSNETEEIKKIEPGIYGISNALLDTAWPKVENSKATFNEIINNDEPDREALFELLNNKTRYPREQLPDTGLSDEMEVAVSSAFIETENYGTRCSTLLFIDNDLNVTFIEKTYRPKPSGNSTVEFSFGAN